ncbi:hypothetical protein LRS10_21060 [Phenylobacterium sp. J426]|uniref:hypothetical protein n=1 Tax=Phenylobacterium sp. J426 TaxID=2898439 RepID=UPI0021512EF5|nr:hypothetical protein [Phenylobacterium sp. J426]MCR5876413.1 hypothetical protein [Phenylobacterium sp. J426]
MIEADAGYTPDGEGLYFISARHDPANEDFDIWYVRRGAGGRWGDPERLPPPVNSPAAELLPRADSKGPLLRIEPPRRAWRERHLCRRAARGRELGGA